MGGVCGPSWARAVSAGLVSVRGVRSGQSWPLIKMPLESLVQTAGENHPTDLPGEKSREQREIRTLRVLAARPGEAAESSCSEEVGPGPFPALCWCLRGVTL